MKTNHTLALIIAFYLSKYDLKAYSRFGYHTQLATHRAIGEALEVNPNSVKNMRDEFDPIHENKRAGWYHRPLRPSRVKVVDAFEHLSEEELFEVCSSILTDKVNLYGEIAELIEQISKKDDGTITRESYFIVRGPTGRKAEEAFIEFYRQTGKPFSGNLQDTRDLGVGYDFQISNENGDCFVEVKGLMNDKGGIQMTSKEWAAAKQHKQRYFVVIVRNISSEPTIQIIQNPAAKIAPQKSIHTTVQIRWNVSEKALANLSSR